MGRAVGCVTWGLPGAERFCLLRDYLGRRHAVRQLVAKAAHEVPQAGWARMRREGLRGACGPQADVGYLLGGFSGEAVAPLASRSTPAT